MNKKLRNYPFWCLTTFFCLGVFASSYSNDSLFICVLLFCITTISVYTFKGKVSNNKFLIFSGVVYLLLGSIRFQLASPKYQTNHIVNFVEQNTNQKIVFSIKQIFKSTQKTDNYKIKIQSINNKNVKGYALLSIKKDSVTPNYKLGDSFVIHSKMYTLKKTGNPYAFEYSDYLKNEHITYKIWTKPHQLYKIESLANPWNTFSNKIRNHLENHLKKQHLSPEVLQITEALVLGNKSSISQQLKTDFSNAGVIHVLAISGLHIGIIFLMLNGIFSFVFPSSKNSISATIVILIILWAFAWFSGGSPSALRATTMFTCFQISKSILRHQHPINALFLSILVLVIVDPNLLFSVGFQLSVSAVSAIIIGVPKLLTLWYPNSWIVNKLWSIICMSICAQVGILPLSIYYFHQFSSLFLLANIPIMLVIVFVLCAAIIVVVSSSFWIIPKALINIYNEFILLIIDYVSWVASFDDLILKKLYLNPISVLYIYVLFGFFIYLYKYPYSAPKISLAVFSIAIIVGFYEFYQRLLKDELWLLNQYNNTVVAEITSNNLQVLSKKGLKSQDIKFLIQPISFNLHYSNFKTKTLQNSYQYKGYSIHVISSEKQLPRNTQNSILILEGSPKINLERVIISGKPKLIIASNNNYTNLTQKWKATCSSKQVAFYNLSESGAFNISKALSDH